MRKILIVSDGLIHPPIMARWTLRNIMTRLDGFSHSHVRSLEALPKDLEKYSAIILYVHHQKISAEALGMLDDFISTGGGLLGVHSATASYQQADHFFEIIGGRFVNHGPVEKFTVHPTGSQEIFQGGSAFEVVDELYIHETLPGIEVHFTANSDGEDIPVVWTRGHGRGKVCYAEPGHRTASMKVPAYQRVLQQGLLWVAGG